MPLYMYKAKKSSSQTVTGEIDAPNQDDAVEAIAQLGMVPVVVEEKTAHGVLVSDIKVKRISTRELLGFTKQLASLSKSGVPLLKSLELISVQTSNLYFAKVISDISSGVRSGRSFSSCLADYPAIFSDLYVAMAKVGEEMGNLREVLQDVADYHRRQHEIQSKLVSVSVYPLLMLCVGLGTVYFILSFVLPKMTVMFRDAHTVLPLPTRIVMALSAWLKIFGLPLVIVIVAAGIFFWRWRQTSVGKWRVGTMVLSVPGIRDVVIKANLARFARTLHLLLTSGLPLVRAMDIATATVINPQLRQDLREAVEGLTAGQSLAQCLRKSQWVPAMTIQVVAVAEESGAVAEALADLAQTYESDLQQTTQTLMSLMEPLLILTIGGIVAFIVFAMLLPIFSMDLLAR